MKKSFVLIIFILGFFLSFGQNTQPSITDLLEKIESLQVKSDPFYDEGLFKTQRSWFTSNGVEDNNIFITASLVYILKTLKPKLDKRSQEIIDRITDRANSLYKKYINRNGDVTYNFWQTVPPDIPFPNGGFLLTMKKHRLPDDYDDTSIIRLAANPDSVVNKKIRAKMIEYANRPERKEVKNAPQKYRSFKAYEVLFADKMDQEYDVVAMCNTLQFVVSNDFVLQPIDHSTISFIKKVIRDNDHITSAEEVSPYYPTATLILYHVSRLISIDDQGLLDEIRPDVVSDLRNLLVTKQGFDKILLASSLRKLSEEVTEEINHTSIQSELDEFIFFQFKRRDVFNAGVIPALKWKSEALNLTLYLEYLVLSKED